MAGVPVLSRLNSMPSGLSVCTCIYTHMYMHTVHAYIHVHIHTCILFIPVSWQMASTSQLLCNFMVNIGMNNSLFDIYLQFLWLFIVYVRWKGTAVAYGNSVCRLWRSLHTPLQTWVPSHMLLFCALPPTDVSARTFKTYWFYLYTCVYMYVSTTAYVDMC